MNPQLLYINYFEYAAVFFTTVIWLVFISRHSYFSRSSLYFTYFSLATLLTAVFDIVSSYTISFPGSVPIGVNYFFSAGYLFFNILTALIFLLYADSIAKIGRIRNIVPLGVRIIAIVFLALCISTPWTHFIIYFDDDKSYHLGSMHFLIYVIGSLSLLTALLILNKGRSRFSSFQRRMMLYFVLALFSSTVLQIIYPQILLGAFNMSVIGFFIYVAFENPAYYYFKDTPCFNRDAFSKIMKLHIKNKESYSLVLCNIPGFSYTFRSLNYTQKENLYREISERLAREFKKDVFFLDTSRYAVRFKGESTDLGRETMAEKSFRMIFSTPFSGLDRKLTPRIFTAILPSGYDFSSLDELDGVIRLLMDAENNPNMDTHEKAMAAVEKKQRRDQVEKAVEKAIKNDGFMVYYQPILNVKTGRFESAEALLRLIDDDLGFISPEEFIPITESAGNIVSLGEIVLRKVCTFVNSLDEDRMGLKYIEVNLSPIQCQQEGISDEIISLLKECNTELSLINFEITETAEAEFHENSEIVKNIHKMNNQGISFSIDDFGSGFASIDHLFAVPFDLVKVDKHILWNAMKNQDAMIILKNTFRMIKELNKKILVEGVETQEMVDMLVENDCDYLQGFFYSKPIPEADFISFITEKNGKTSILS